MITLPTLEELYSSIILDLESQFETTINEDGKTVLRAFAATQAAKMKQYYLSVALLQKNIFVDTCDEETLLRFGIIKIGRYPFAAVSGDYTLTVTGTIGGVIPASTTFKADDTALNPGVLYMLDTQFVMTATTDTITVRALTAGDDGGLNVGDTLTATAPIPLVNSEATTASETTQPLAAETIEAYRSVVIASYRLEAQGGAATDYRIWAADAQGVQNVYPYAKSNATGEVNLFVEAIVADSSDGKGTPTQAILDEVESVVNFSPDTTLPTNERGRRPLQVIVNYLPITPLNVDITITGAVGFTVAIKAQVLVALTAYVNAIRPFIPACDLVEDENDVIDTNGIISIIVTTKPGAVFTSITLSVNSNILTTYEFTGGFIPYLNSVNYA